MRLRSASRRPLHQMSFPWPLPSSALIGGRESIVRLMQDNASLRDAAPYGSLLPIKAFEGGPGQGHSGRWLCRESTNCHSRGDGNP